MKRGMLLLLAGLGLLGGSPDAAEAPWGETPALRVIYYLPAGVEPSDEDRTAIRSQLELVHGFFARYGIVVNVEDRVYEIRAPAGDDRSFLAVKRRVKSEGLYAAGRTVVFTPFDSGAGAANDMAITGINDARTERASCDARSPRKAWWCGLPPASHTGGSVHEIGHLFGLSHPPRREAAHTVMGEHWRLGAGEGIGLLPVEVQSLQRRFRRRERQ